MIDARYLSDNAYSVLLAFCAILPTLEAGMKDLIGKFIEAMGLKVQVH
jgi:hypothetical protein